MASCRSRNAQASTSGSTSSIRLRQSATSSAEVMRPARISAAASLSERAARLIIHTSRSGNLRPSSRRVEIIRQPQRELGKDIDQRHGHKDHPYEWQGTPENVHKLHRFRRYALEIEGGHRHRWRIEGRLRVERHHNAEENRIDMKVVEQRQKDGHENDDDFRPFQWPAEQENDDLR